MTREKALEVSHVLYSIERFETFMDEVENIIDDYYDDVGNIEPSLMQILQSELERREKVLEEL